LGLHNDREYADMLREAWDNYWSKYIWQAQSRHDIPTRQATHAWQTRLTNTSR
jgi:hypothetical protein